MTRGSGVGHQDGLGAIKRGHAPKDEESEQKGRPGIDGSHASIRSQARRDESGSTGGRSETVAGDGAPVLILDTNVVLDWLYFHERRCLRLADAITGGRARWVASAAMRAEMQHVLGRGIPGRWPGDAQSVLHAWDRWATMIEASDAPAPRSLRCTDADDQMFIDLAIQVRAHALLSSDRAVLKLARRAAAQGLRIMTVAAWQTRAAGS